jgi:hypothetical protein
VWRRSKDDDIEMDVGAVGYENVMAQDRVQWRAFGIRGVEPSGYFIRN